MYLTLLSLSAVSEVQSGLHLHSWLILYEASSLIIMLLKHVYT